jgi:Carotenoid biosynthesis protein
VPLWIHEFVVAPLVFALAYAHTWKAWGARRATLELAALVLYGFALERSAMWLFASHDYRGVWLLAPFGVPLAIALTWAALIVSAMALGRRLGFRTLRARALAAALVAVALDLLIEPVAVRCGFWCWTPPGAWLGIPLGNFVGWGIVVGAYGWGAERFARDVSLARQALRRGGLALASIALLLGVGLVWTRAGCERLFDDGRGPCLGYGLWIGTLALALTANRRRTGMVPQRPAPASLLSSGTRREAEFTSAERRGGLGGVRRSTPLLNDAPRLVLAVVGATFALDAWFLRQPELWTATVTALVVLASVLWMARAPEVNGKSS